MVNWSFVRSLMCVFRTEIIASLTQTEFVFFRNSIESNFYYYYYYLSNSQHILLTCCFLCRYTGTIFARESTTFGIIC